MTSGGSEFTRAQSSVEGPMPNWYVAYTSANHEKRVSQQLLERSVEYFLPLYASVRHWKDRRIKLQLPLFPGYVFVKLDPRDRLRILQVPGVARLVGFNGRPYPLPEGEIESLRAGVMNSLRIEPHPYLSAGCRVRIKRGPLAGVEGILVRKKNVHRVVLSISSIARSAAVEVDGLDVERIP
jgi:transcription antitermination factor NusG